MNFIESTNKNRVPLKIVIRKTLIKKLNERPTSERGYNL